MPEPKNKEGTSRETALRDVDSDKIWVDGDWLSLLNVGRDDDPENLFKLNEILRIQLARLVAKDLPAAAKATLARWLLGVTTRELRCLTDAAYDDRPGHVNPLGRLLAKLEGSADANKR